MAIFSIAILYIEIILFGCFLWRLQVEIRYLSNLSIHFFFIISMILSYGILNNFIYLKLIVITIFMFFHLFIGFLII